MFEVTEKDIEENKSLKFYKLSFEEKNFIEELSAITLISPLYVRYFFLGILFQNVIQEKNPNEIVIPYIGKIDISDVDGSGVKFTPYKSFTDVIEKKKTGEESWVSELLLNQIGKNFLKKLSEAKSV